MNLYAYVGGDPVNVDDPLGLAPSGRAPKSGRSRDTCESFAAIARLIDPIADYVSVSIPTPIPFVGVQVTVDSYGRVYYGAGAGIGKPPVGVAVGFRDPPDMANPTNWEARRKDDLADFISGFSINFQAGPGLEYSPGNGIAALIGTPGIGVSRMGEAMCR